MTDRQRVIVCFSHLGWNDGLFQRPQQVMTRLAESGYKVLYFACVGRLAHTEHPMAGPVQSHPGVFVYTLGYSPLSRKLAGLRRWMAGIRVAQILASHRVSNPILWFYHPALFALGYSHRDSAIVYDVMDHFTAFEQSKDDFYFDELTVLAEADIVFTGGVSLDRHIRSMVDALNEGADHARRLQVDCLPSGVDLLHFARARRPNAEGSYHRPVFGYFGAVDERIDWQIITKLAERTDGTVILAGPVLRKPQVELPGNVHLPGPVPYSQLPELLSGFDVCLIPFRKTPLVDYVSPTKTPEYLAGGKPVVSTAIPDVISTWGDIVKIGADLESFISHCLDQVQHPSDADRLASAASARARTWDEITSIMASRMEDASRRSARV